MTWLFDPQHSLSVFFSIFLLLMLITMVFLAPLPSPPRLLLFVALVLFGLHCILNLTIHIHCHLDHFHFLATSCAWFWPMNIDPFYSFPTNIQLGVINGSSSFGLLVQLAMNYPLEFVSSCSWNSSETSVSWWHTLCILACYFLMSNIPL